MIKSRKDSSFHVSACHLFRILTQFLVSNTKCWSIVHTFITFLQYWKYLVFATMRMITTLTAYLPVDILAFVWDSVRALLSHLKSYTQISGIQCSVFKLKAWLLTYHKPAFGNSFCDIRFLNFNLIHCLVNNGDRWPQLE